MRKGGKEGGEGIYKYRERKSERVREGGRVRERESERERGER